MNTIPPLDLRRQYQTLQDDLNAAVLAVLASGQYIGGAVVAQFEQAFAQYIDTPFCISCNSGTDALYLALRALDIGAGDEVITSPFTFIATAEIISMTGATPVFVDIVPETFNLDPQQVEQAITPRTKAMIPVHLFGHPAEMTPLMAIAQAHKLSMVEDCAQATGAEWKGQKVGSLGDVGCFSFYPSKNLGGCGDGGAVTTHRPELAEKMRLIRDHGRRSGYLHETVGINSRLDSLQAAILAVKLPHLDQWNNQRLAVAQTYHRLLSHLPDIGLPQTQPEAHCVWNQYTLRIPHLGDLDDPNPRRDRIRQQLSAQGIQSMVYYPIPLHRQPVYTHLNYRTGQLPAADRAALEVLSLPMFPELTLAEQEQIHDSLKEVLSGG
ncbi:MAG: DegT/DnrJ/EryC1/StrS family aminotransferase [Thermosynechococcaceae cyanobacterium]